ncbi:MAG: hypothetical protein GEV09_21705 [Pseudonocardiaceae bacterium]|nr:hypothetical protein [Pseudonocardiaceae bacterium]
MTQRAAQLDAADQARGSWYAATAATRDAAHRARGALETRGIDIDADDDKVTAAEWLAAHHAEQRVEDAHRVVRDETELTDGGRDDAAAAAPDGHLGADATEVADTSSDVAEADDATVPVVETDVADIREVTEPDTAERADPQEPHRVPTADESAASVARAQAALAEIEARRQADAAREAADAEQQHTQRREQLTTWAEHDRAAEQSTTDDADGDDDDLVRQR